MAIPATFMGAVTLTYILMADEGFRLSSTIAYPVGLIFAASLFIIYCVTMRKCAQKYVVAPFDSGLIK